VVTGIKRPFESLFQTLSQSEKKYRALFEHMEEGVAVYTPIFQGHEMVDYQFFDLNARYATMMGMNREELIERLELISMVLLLILNTIKRWCAVVSREFYCIF
jgi:PAS domain-containing protein